MRKTHFSLSNGSQAAFCQTLENMISCWNNFHWTESTCVSLQCLHEPFQTDSLRKLSLVWRNPFLLKAHRSYNVLRKFSFSCQWNGLACNMSESFTSIWTDLGLCYTFNGRSSDLHATDTGESKTALHISEQESHLVFCLKKKNR